MLQVSKFQKTFIHFRFLKLQNLLPKCLQELPKFLSEKRIRLLIIDSIAGPFRFEAEDNVLENKYKTIEETGKLLQKMWKDFGLAVVCINQV